MILCKATLVRYEHLRKQLRHLNCRLYHQTVPCICFLPEAFGLNHPDSYYYLRQSCCFADKTINDKGTFQDVLVGRTLMAFYITVTHSATKTLSQTIWLEHFNKQWPGHWFQAGSNLLGPLLIHLPTTTSVVNCRKIPSCCNRKENTNQQASQLTKPNLQAKPVHSSTDGDDSN